MMAKAGRARSLVLSLAALGWGAVVFSAAFWFPVYGAAEEVCLPDRPSECRVIGESTSTLVDTNGVDVLYVLAVPVVASLLLIGFLLWLRAGPARWLGWCVVAGLWAVTLLGMASVGMAFAPSALLLTVAVSRSHSSHGAERGMGVRSPVRRDRA